MKDNWFQEYLELYRTSLFDEKVINLLSSLKGMILEAHSRGNKIIILGNGGSAAIASHTATDFSKNARIEMVTYNDASLITCLANDYGYENWMSSCIEFYGKEGDVVILISSSGKSRNVINAAEKSKELNIPIITFTGFDENNPLKQLGDLNIWVDSKAYNIVEMTHQIWLLAVCDAIIGKAEYPAN